MGVRSLSGKELAALHPSPGAGTPYVHAPSAADERATAPQTQSSPVPKAERVQEALRKVNEDLISRRAGVRLRLDEENKRIVIQIMDENDEVVKQIPPEELLRLSNRLRELQGALFDKRA